MTSASRNDSEPSVYGRIFVRCNIKQNVLTPRGSNRVGPGEVDKRSDYTSCPSWTNLTVCPFFFLLPHSPFRTGSTLQSTEQTQLQASITFHRDVWPSDVLTKDLLTAELCVGYISFLRYH